PPPALPETPPAPTNPQPQIASNATAQMIDVAQVQGQVHAQSVHRVGELADRNPNETASIIRQWLSEPA
ncbi:MAG TPA: flagellar M-ring protein FliF, partial [Afipia sp.]|nr:flagellar M-ring protein FliF [Afipia sp.]